LVPVSNTADIWETATLENQNVAVSSSNAFQPHFSTAIEKSYLGDFDIQKTPGFSNVGHLDDMVNVISYDLQKPRVSTKLKEPMQSHIENGRNLNCYAIGHSILVLKGLHKRHASKRP
jgi:hypothetical protein